MLTQRLLRAGGLLTLGGGKPDSSLFIHAPRGGLFSLRTVVMVNTRAFRDTWMWAQIFAYCSGAAPSGILSGVASEQIINLFLTSLSSSSFTDNQVVKLLNINAKYITRGSQHGWVGVLSRPCKQSGMRQSNMLYLLCCNCCRP